MMVESPKYLGRMSSPTNPLKQRFGSLVACAPNHAIRIGILSLCTRYTSFYRVAEHTRPRTQFRSIVPVQNIGNEMFLSSVTKHQQNLPLI